MQEAQGSRWTMLGSEISVSCSGDWEERHPPSILGLGLGVPLPHWEVLLPWVSPLPWMETSHLAQICPVPQTRLYSIAAAVVAMMYPVCSGLLCLGVKERPGKGVQSEHGKQELGQDSSWAWVWF